MIANSLLPLRCSVCLDCQLSKLPSTSTLFPPWVQLMAVGTSAGSVVAHAGYSPPCRPCDGMGTVGVCGLFEIVRESSSSVVRPFPASPRRSLTPRPSPLASSRPPRARARARVPRLAVQRGVSNAPVRQRVRASPSSALALVLARAPSSALASVRRARLAPASSVPRPPRSRVRRRGEAVGVSRLVLSVSHRARRERRDARAAFCRIGARSSSADRRRRRQRRARKASERTRARERESARGARTVRCFARRRERRRGRRCARRHRGRRPRD